MTGLKAKAIAAFEEDAKRKSACAKAQFEKDFGVGPDETGYLGNHLFLFRVDDLHIRGHVECPDDQYAIYRLAKTCENCTELVLAGKLFSDLAGLGEAIRLGFDSGICGDCGRSQVGG